MNPTPPPADATPELAPPEAAVVASRTRRAPRGYWGDVWHRLKRNKLSMLALAYVVLLSLVALFAPFIVGSRPIAVYYKGEYYFPGLTTFYRSGYENPIFREGKRPRDKLVFDVFKAERFLKKDPDSKLYWPLVLQDPYLRIKEDQFPDHPGNPYGNDGEPSRLNWFGTTKEGVDVFAMMVYGTSYALLIGFVSTGIAALIGMTLGAIAGYFGGWIDSAISRLIEIVLSIPTLILIIAVVSIVKNPTLWHVMAVIGATTWPGIARLTRAEFLKLKQMEYIAAARVLGAGHFRIMFRHLLPNALAPVLVPITFGIASAILIESGLSFLGIGASPTEPRWGVLLSGAAGGPHHVVAGRVSRRGDFSFRLGLQPDRRRAAGSDRSEVEKSVGVIGFQDSVFSQGICHHTTSNLTPLKTEP
ncbi:MAG: ABC transporter permease [Pirellulales bacterium]